ncbi:MAG: DUF805 domain-containing protein [Desulfobacteraceae bacterium]|nr:DUF805 domain-containing protein [Desulfobacteraceae bacterium]
MNWYFEVLKKYALFNGRARREEYWMFFLINIIIMFVLLLLGLGGGSLAILSTLYSLAVTIPGIAVSARRLHDINRSGWWMFISLVPVIGAIILLVFTVQDSQPGENRYGQNPKIETA